jgi:hypothetical protein
VILEKKAKSAFLAAAKTLSNELQTRGGALQEGASFTLGFIILAGVST